MKYRKWEGLDGKYCDANGTILDEGSPEERLAVLADYLEMLDEIDNFSYSWCDTCFEVGDKEYMVLTDEEADKQATEYIKESVFAFRAGFIIDHSKLPYEAEEMVEAFTADKCEGANETILALITDIDEFVEDAISADGRGHYLNTYDCEEHEFNGYFIYRTN